MTAFYLLEIQQFIQMYKCQEELLTKHHPTQLLGIFLFALDYFFLKNKD